MIRVSLFSFSIIFTVCYFCGKDFVSLARPVWRCWSRLNRTNESDFENATTTSRANVNIEHICTTKIVRCSCRKSFRGIRGLKMHQRSRHVIRGMQSDDLEILDNDDCVWDGSDQNQFTFEDCTVKCGVQLPRSSQQWSIASDFFKAAFSNVPITDESLDHVIRKMNETIYDYVKENYGYVQSILNSPFVHKYKDMSVTDLKKCLKQLKLKCEDINEIKYVSRLLRDRLRKDGEHPSSIDQTGVCIHDECIAKNFWGYIMNV